MADSKELQSQLEIQAQINEAIRARSGLLKQQGNILSSQVKMAIEMCNAMECKDLDGMTERIDNLNSALSDASDQAAEFGENLADSANEASEAAEGTSSGFRNMAGNIKTSHVAGVGFLKGFAQGLVGGLMDIKNFASAILSIGKAVFQVGRSILAMPFVALEALVGMANDGAGSGAALREAYEELRGTLGSIEKGEGKAAVDLFKGFREQSNNLAGTGLSLARVFGRGQDGLAAALQDATKTLSEMNAAGQEAFKGLSREGKVKVAMITKALDISAEAMDSFALSARMAGMTLDDYMGKAAKNILIYSKQFGISEKLITKDLADMTKDFVTFGHMSQQEMLQTSVYARKLGTDIEGLKGVLDKFSDFAGTQSAVSELNQTLGIQLDTLKLLRAENPADTIDQMREAFFAAGKSIEDMDRHQKAALKDLYGMDDAMMKAALSAENAGMSMDEIRAASEANQDTQMTEKEVMLELAKAIKKMTESGGDGFKSFFDAFAKGFRKGAIQASGFRKVLHNIRKSLRVFMQFGKEAGKLFGQMLKDFGLTKSLKKIFDPKDFRKLFGLPGGKTGLLGIFRKFKDSITGKGEYSPEQMWKDMKKEFGKFFSGKGEALKTLQKFFESMIRALGKAIGSLLALAGQAVADGIRYLIAWIKGEVQPVSGAVTEGLGGAFSDAFNEIGAGIADAWKVLGPALMDLITILWEKYGHYVMKVVEGFMTYMMVKGIVNGIMASVGAAAVMGAIKWMAVKLGLMAAPVMAQGMATNVTTAGAMSSLWGIVFATHGPGVAGLKFIWVAIKNGLGLGLFIASALIPLAGVMAGFMAIISQFSTGTFVKAMIAMALAVGSLFALSQLMMTMEAISVELPAILMTAGSMALIMAALGSMTAILMIMASFTENVKTSSMIGFFVSMGIILLMTWGLSTILMGMSSITEQLPLILKGLVGIGLIAAGLGLLGAALVWVLGKAGTPEQLKAASSFFIGFSVFLITMALLIPIAAGIAALIAASWGLGLVFIIGGIAAIATFAVAAVDRIIPAVELINRVKIDNPKTFETKVKAIIDVMKSIGSFVDSAASLMDASWDPSFGGKSSTMAENLGAMNTLLDNLIKGGIQDILDKLMNFAQYADVDELALKGMSAITATVGAVGQLMAGLSPDSDVVKYAYKYAEETMVGQIEDMLIPVAAYMSRMEKLIPKVMKSTLGFIEQLKPLLIGADFSQIGPFASAIGPILGGIGTMMDAIKPGGEAWGALKSAAETTGAEEKKIADTIHASIETTANTMPGIFTAAGGMLKTMIESLKPLLSIVTSSGANPKAISAAAKVIGAIMTAVTGMMQAVNKGMGAVLEHNKLTSTQAYEEYQIYQGRKLVTKKRKLKGMKNLGTGGLAQLKKVIGEFLPVMRELVPIISGAVSTILRSASQLKIRNVRSINAKLGAVAKAVGILKDITSLFGSGVFDNIVPKKRAKKLEGKDISNLTATIHSLEAVISAFFTDKKLMKKLFDAVAGMKVQYGQLGHLKNISRGFEMVGKVLQVMKTIGELVSGKKNIFSSIPKISKNTQGARKLVTDLLGGFFPKTAAAVRQQLSKNDDTPLNRLVQNIDALIPAFFGPEGLMSRLLRAVVGLNIKYGDIGHLKNISRAFKAIGDVIEVVKQISHMTKDKRFDHIRNKPDPNANMSGAVTSNLDITADNMDAFFDVFFGNKELGTDGVIKRLVDKIKGVKFSAADQRAMKRIATEMGLILTAMTPITLLNDAITKWSKTASTSDVGAFSGMSGVLTEQMDNTFDNIIEVASSVQGKYADVMKVMKGIDKKKSGAIATASRRLIGMVQAVNIANAKLNSISLGEPNKSRQALQVTLDNFATALGTNTRDVKIKANEKIDVHLNVKVVMNAKKISKVLVDKKIMDNHALQKASTP